MANKSYIKKFIFICTTFILLNGCVTASYPLTDHLPQAQLGFAESKAFNNTNVGIMFADYKACTSSRPLPTFPALMTINADQFTTVLVTHAIGYTQLQFVATFYAEPDHIYLITTDNVKQGDNITTTLYILDEASDKPTPLVAREYEMHYVASSACLNSDVNFSKAPKVYSLQQTARNVPAIYLMKEKTKN
jgi:hypothetical protein